MGDTIFVCVIAVLVFFNCQREKDRAHELKLKCYKSEEAIDAD
jgi:hypothetical protein